MTINEALKFAAKYNLNNKARDDLIRIAVHEENPKATSNDRLKGPLKKKDMGLSSCDPIDEALHRIKSGYYHTNNKTGLRPRN